MIDFKVLPDDGEPYKVTATARDVLVWERTNKGKVFSDISTRQSMVDLYCMAWIASRRLGLIAADLKLAEFEKTHDLEIVEEEEGESDPTQTGPSDGPSSPSP